MAARSLRAGAPAPTAQPDTTPLTRAEAELAVAELRYQAALYSESIHAMMDGVTLGAEQVQNKRLDLLEAGPTTDATDVFLAVVLTLILEGTVGPSIAGAVTSAVLRPFMRSTARAIRDASARDVGKLAGTALLYREEAAAFRSFQSVASQATARELRMIAQQLDDRAAQLAAAAASGRRAVVGTYRELRTTLTSVTDFVRDNLVAAAKVPGAVRGTAGTPTPLPVGTSPAVEVQAAAMASAADLRLTLAATVEALTVSLRDPATTVAQATSILQTFRAEQPVDIAVLRATVQLATEALIWAHLYTDDHTTDRRGSGTAGSLETRLLSLPVDPKLLDYLLVRFGDEVERWALGTAASIPVVSLDANHLLRGADLAALVGPTKTPGWWQALSRPVRTDFLVQYLVAIRRSTTPALTIGAGR
jgi:hypothetical protein